MKIPIEILALVLSLNGYRAWSFDDQSKWQQEFPTCGGKQQSPIEINLLKTNLKKLPPVVFSNYNLSHNVTISNNGKFALIEFPSTSIRTPELTGGPLDSGSKYQLVNIHFHWGSNNSVGSEHVVNKKRFPLELHALHYNTKYSNLEEALLHTDGVTVLAAFGLPTTSIKNSGLRKVTNTLPSITKVGSAKNIQNLDLSFLLRSLKTLNKHTFMSYIGSLTTPPCSEVVTWIIQTKPILVTQAQLNRFRKLQLSIENNSGNNWRQLQRKFGRKVFLGIA